MAVPERHNEVLASFYRAVNKFLEKQKKPRHYGLKILLYPAEIDAIKWIGENREISVTRLADLSGVTKGAISQTLARLQQKKILKKTVDPVNKSRIVLKLTTVGHRVFKAYRQKQQRQDKELTRFLASLKSEDIRILKDFFALVEQSIDIPPQL